MPSTQIGKLPPRYSFLLNPYSHVRLSKCPCCERLTHQRKFALLIHIETRGAVLLGKTCRYCTPCELIVAHRDELERELACCSVQFQTTESGRGYLVLGTVDLKKWRKGLDGEERTIGEMREHMSDFKTHLDLHVEPGGWQVGK